MSLNSCQIRRPAQDSDRGGGPALLEREVSVKRGVRNTPAFNRDFLLNNKLKETETRRQVLALGFAAL